MSGKLDSSQRSVCVCACVHVLSFHSRVQSRHPLEGAQIVQESPRSSEASISSRRESETHHKASYELQSKFLVSR